MHRNFLPRCLGWSLLIVLGLHVLTSQPLCAQPPGDKEDEKDKARTIKVPADQAILVQAANNERIKEAVIDQAGVKIARAEQVKDNPQPLRDSHRRYFARPHLFDHHA
jgi:hypothetical protein